MSNKYISEQSNQFKNKIIIVTGSTQGSGAETAKLLASRGAKGITICGRNKEKGNKVKSEIEGMGAECLYVQADLEKLTDCKKIVSETDKKFKTVDSFINVAAFTEIMIKNVANSVSGHQIRVNGVNLGWTDTPAETVIQKKFHNADDNWLKKAEAKVPFKRLNKPLDVAKILAFLCSEESGIMTGSIVDFDQTVAGWHSYSAYDTKILDDSILGE
jgi:NAD(P)-dependent dehydrogenase (short-subunit alcohol dehydrogenase family)